MLALAQGRMQRASELLDHTEDNGKVETVLAAYAKSDWDTLDGMRDDDSSQMAACLLIRGLYECGHWSRAADVAEELFKQYAVIPSVTCICSQACGLRTAKRSIPALVGMCWGVVMSGDGSTKLDLRKVRTALQRILDMKGSPAVVPEPDFETFLKTWAPFKGAAADGLLMDNQRMGHMLRAMYENALAMYFELLFDRWSVLSAATNFANRLGTIDPDKPMHLLFMAEVNRAKGQREQARKQAMAVLKARDVSSAVAARAWTVFGETHEGDVSASLPARHMDGRPEALRRLAGYCEQGGLLEDALALWNKALAMDPLPPYQYTPLALLEGNATCFNRLLRENPSSPLLKNAIRYYRKRPEQEAQDKILALYDQAIELAPDDFKLKRERVVWLRKTGQLDKALAGAKELLELKPTGLDNTYLLTAMTYIYLARGEARAALSYADEQVDSAQADAMVSTALAYEAVGKTPEAEKVFIKALNRYSDSDWISAAAAGFFWRQGQDGQAAELLGVMRESMRDLSNWYGVEFCKAFAKAPVGRILGAVKAIREHGGEDVEVEALATRLAWTGRRDAASAILTPLTTEDNQHAAYYRVMRFKVSGRNDQQALDELYEGLDRKMLPMLVMAMFREQQFDLALMHDFSEDLKNPRLREFVPLFRLVSWLALGKMPAPMAREFEDHYSRASNDIYHTVGRFLLGKVDEDALLGEMNDPKSRCELAYYLGLGARLRGDFKTAGRWYAVCASTGMLNIGEFHWARRELENWRALGMAGRKALAGEEKAVLNELHKGRFLLEIEHSPKLKKN